MRPDALVHRSASALTLAGIVIFAAVFGTLGVAQPPHFGTWSYDMGIYDQAFWLVSRGGQTFMTVRGLDFWGHHLNLVAYLFAPFYWLGAGPAFLYVVQASCSASARCPVYLIAKDRFEPAVWSGWLFAVVYLLYAPIQWISLGQLPPRGAGHHAVPVRLVVRHAQAVAAGSSSFVVLALSTREDTALAVIMLGVVLLVINRRSEHRRRDRRMARRRWPLGVVWYLVATQLVIPHFNDGNQPFYLEYFYGSYGGTSRASPATILRHPDRVVRDAIQPDRIRFYRDLLLPLGGLPLLAPLHLLMALPQMLASVIGGQPVRPADPVPVHVDDDRPDRDRRDRGRPRGCGAFSWCMRGGARRSWLLVVRLRHQRGLVAVADRRALRRVGPGTTRAARRSQRGGDAGARRRRRSRRRTTSARTCPTRAIYDWPNPFWPAYWGETDGDRLHRVPERVGRRVPRARHEPLPRRRPAAPVHRVADRPRRRVLGGALAPGHRRQRARGAPRRARPRRRGGGAQLSGHQPGRSARIDQPGAAWRRDAVRTAAANGLLPNHRGR